MKTLTEIFFLAVGIGAIIGAVIVAAIYVSFWIYVSANRSEEKESNDYIGDFNHPDNLGI